MSKNKKITIYAILIAAAILAIAGIIFVKVICPIKHYTQICLIKSIPAITNIIMTGDQCGRQNGRILNTLGGETCASSEINIGKVEGIDCPCICCVKKDQVQQPISKEQAIELIAQKYPKVIQARGDSNIPAENIKQINDVLQIEVLWGWCPECHCVFEAKNDRVIEVIDAGESPQICEAKLIAENEQAFFCNINEDCAVKRINCSGCEFDLACLNKYEIDCSLNPPAEGFCLPSAPSPYWPKTCKCIENKCVNAECLGGKCE